MKKDERSVFEFGERLPETDSFDASLHNENGTGDVDCAENQTWEGLLF